MKRRVSASVTTAFTAILGINLVAAACGDKSTPTNTTPTNTAKTNSNSEPPKTDNANAAAPAAGTRLEGEQLAKVKAQFKDNCAECHLETGKGSPDHKKNDIPDFTNATWQAKESDDDLFKAVKNGKDDEMPAFGEEISEADIRLLVQYVRSLSTPASEVKK